MPNISHKSPPKVSVICTTYNHGPYLRQALDGVLIQKTDFPFEVLLGEDCSPDNSREILREYEERYPGFFQIFFREKNMGATNNWTDLFLRARGEYIITLETDDYWTDPDKLQKQADFLDSHKEYIGCADNFIEINESGDIICQNSDTGNSGRDFTLQVFLTNGSLTQSAALMHRNFRIDGEDYSIFTKSSSIVGDLTLLSLLLLRGSIFLMPESMSVYRRIKKKDGTSFSSQPLAKTLPASMRQMVMLEEYFRGKIEYTRMKSHCITQYFYHWIKGEEGFSAADLRSLWKQAGPAARKKAVLFILGYPVRKVQNRRNRFLQKDHPHE